MISPWRTQTFQQWSSVTLSATAWIIVWVLFIPSLSLAQDHAIATEALGQFRFSEFSLQPRLRLEEPGQGGFEIRQTWLGFE